MRFRDLVTQVVVPIMVEQQAKTQVFASQLRFGWESWLQVEIYWALRSLEGVRSFEREPVYPGSRLRADFNFVTQRSPNVTIWVELKAQRERNIEQVVAELSNDMVKLRQSFPTGPSDYGGAIAVAPIGGTQAILTVARAAILAHPNLGPGCLAWVSYYALSGRGVSTGNLANPTTWPSDPNAPVILAYVQPE